MLRVYLSARWQRQEEMRGVRTRLESLGVKVNASWLDEKIGDRTEREAAEIDVNEVSSADILIAFTETPEVGYYTGGRHVELGVAIALSVPIVCIGPRENIFHHMERVTQFDALGDWIASVNLKAA